MFDAIGLWLDWFFFSPIRTILFIVACLVLVGVISGDLGISVLLAIPILLFVVPMLFDNSGGPFG